MSIDRHKNTFPNEKKQMPLTDFQLQFARTIGHRLAKLWAEESTRPEIAEETGEATDSNSVGSHSQPTTSTSLDSEESCH